MSQSNYEAWRKNLELKIQELKDLSYQYIARKADFESTDANRKDGFEKLKESISSKLKGLSDMFAADRVPSQIGRYQSCFKAISRDQRNSGHNQNYFHSIEALTGIIDQRDEQLSFSDILQTYIDDEDLNNAVDELIGVLNELVEHADDDLSGKISRDLKQILRALKNRRKESPQDLVVWLDLAAKCLIKTVEVNSNIPGIELAYEGAKIAWKARNRLIAIHEKAEVEFANSRKLKFSSEAKKEITDTQIETKLLTIENKEVEEPAREE